MTRRQAGFTLIEMLVVISLLALLVVATASSMRTLAQAESRIDERLLRSDHIRVVDQFLHSVLLRVAQIKVSSPAKPSEKSVLFSSSGNELSWVGVMPARYGAGGVHFMHLAVEEEEGTAKLIFRYAPWTALPEFPDWKTAPKHLVVDNLVKFDVQTEGLPTQLGSMPVDWPRGWQAGWSRKDAVPQRVRLLIEDRHGSWPAIVVPLFTTLQSEPSSGGFVIGGGS